MMIINNDCFFAHQGHCSILDNHSCFRCRFFKTESQYYENYDRNDEILKSKGLERIKYRDDETGELHVTVRRVNHGNN